MFSGLFTFFFNLFEIYHFYLPSTGGSGREKKRKERREDEKENWFLRMIFYYYFNNILSTFNKVIMNLE
jgi:hypothetical protein